VTPLERRLTLSGASAVNVATMIGTGRFVTIPLLLRTMGRSASDAGMVHRSLAAI
jgi:hypothetical protein